MRSSFIYLRPALLALIISIAIPVHAQQFKRIVDSLENILQNGNLTGTARIDMMTKLGTYVARTNSARAIALGRQALAESVKSEHKDGEGEACLVLSMAYQMEGIFDSSLVYADRGIKILSTLPKRVIETGVVYQNKSRAYMARNQTAEAMSTGLEAIKWYEKGGYRPGVADGYVSIAIMFVRKGENERGIAYHKKALAVYQDMKLMSMVAQELNNLAIIETRLKRYSSAIRYHEKSARISIDAKDTSNIADAYSDMGATYYELKRYDKALYYLKQAVDLRHKINEPKNISYTLNYIGLTYEKLGDKTKAIAYMKQAHDIAAKLHNAEQIQDSFEAMSAFYAHNRQLDSAYFFSNKFKLFKDSVEITDDKKAFNSLLIKYETEKKQQQINVLNKENTIQKLSIAGHNKTVAIIVGLFVLSAVIGGLFYYSNKLKQKAAMQQHMLAQQDVLTKAVIEAEEKERKRIASDLHDGVGQLFSAVKMNLSGLIERIKIERDEDRFLAEKTLALVDESCKEVRVISHQMMPNMLLRSGIASDVKSFIDKIDSERLKVTVETNGFKDRIESNVETILYRVIQETVNNVIKHSKASKLDIVLNRDASGITALVTDNGIGFNTIYKDDFAGIGLKNIAARIEYLKGTVEYYSSPEKGTSVSIWVPVA
jgi:two-component system NarL family sensor kinase